MRVTELVEAGWWSKQRKLDKSKEVSVSKKQWLGLHPLKFFPDKGNPLKGVITARLVEKARDYLGKDLPFEGHSYRIEGVEWGTTKKLVALRVQRMW